MNLKKAFINYCLEEKLQINENQKKTIDLLSKFHKENKTTLLDFFRLFNKSQKLAFYLHGDVGVGKTMILDFFYKSLSVSKQRFHFNEFMIKFHDFRHANKNKKEEYTIEAFVKELKKNSKIIYLDELQVTNIVDAMILGKLFEVIFEENIKIIISSNTKINDLYKDGLQSEQFLPFISIITKYSLEHELVIEKDYRTSGTEKLERFFYPLNEKTSFKLNQLLRKLTKNKKLSTKTIFIKGRKFEIRKFFERVGRFNFDELCDQNVGGEDYIKIAEQLDLMVLENIPKFSDNNANKQQRFITLIDIIYEKKIPLIASSNQSINEIGTSQRLSLPFKRTVSRIFELTSPAINIGHKH